MPETTMTWASLAPAISEIWLVTAICVILLVDAFAGQTRRGLTPTLTLVALAVGAALTVMYANVDHRTILFDGMYVADGLAYTLKLFGYVFVAFGLLYSRDYLEERGILRGE
jgi:NADH-quinone oxidoreductase subunit N